MRSHRTVLLAGLLLSAPALAQPRESKVTLPLSR